VVDSETGILLPPKDVEGLQMAIETLASAKALRDRLGAAGRRRCREMFDHRRMVERIEAVYRRLVG
jgi:glycosyltransferase involved in cell wall biosynthesis